ncbi:MAG: transposase, partial [Thermodesulfobacteriota bacterium]
MKDAYTAQEVKDAMGIAISSVHRRAEREAWPYRKRSGKGGGYEYLLADLPADVREALARVAASEAATAGRKHALQLKLNDDLNARAAQAAKQGGLARFVCLDGAAKARAEAKAALVAACREFTTSGGFTIRAGREVFSLQYNAGDIEVDAQIRELVPAVCANSLANWTKALEREGIARLAGNYGQHRRGTGAIDSDPELREFILAMLVDYPHADAKRILRGVEARFSDKKMRVSLRNLQRWLRVWKEQNAQLHLAMTNPDAWRSKYKAAGGDASANVFRLNQRWEIDSTKGDAMLSDGRRHVIIGCIDVYSRRFKLHVARTSSSAGVLAILRRCLFDWGVPEELGTDKGSDYVSRQVQLVLAALKIRQDIAPPFTPEHKPFVERAFKTFSHDLLELAAGFIGHNVAERKAIESRKSMADRLFKTGESVELAMTPEELQTLCDRWTDDVYARDPHAGLNGRAPFQVACDWTEPVARISDERALDILLMPAAGGDGIRRIGKKGIRLDGVWFDHAALGGHEGKQARVLLDDADIGAAYVFIPSADGGWEWLCKAVCPEIAGVSRRDVSIARQRRQKALISQQKKELKDAARSAGTKEIVTEILEHSAIEAGKLTRLPQPSIPHETEALRQAGLAARAQDGPTPAPAGEAQAMRELAAREMAKPAVVHQMPQTPQQRYRRWVKLDE